MPSLGKSAVQSPLFEAREIGGIWDIIMRIPHPSGGASVESIIGIKENTGTPPDEATIARRTCALLNMAAHIDTEDLFIKGATLKLETFSERMAAQSGCQDVEADLRDTNESLRRALKVIGKKFGVSSSSPELVSSAVSDGADKLKASFDQAVDALNAQTEATNQIRLQFSIPLGTPIADVANILANNVAEINSKLSEYIDASARLRQHFMLSGDHGPASTAAAVIAAANSNVKIIEDRSQRLNKALEQLEAIGLSMIEADHYHVGGDLGAAVDALIERVAVSMEPSASSTRQYVRLLDALREIVAQPSATVESLLTYIRSFKATAEICAKDIEAIRDVLELDSDIEDSQIAIIVAECQGQMRDMREANKETAGQLAKADQELAQTRGERDEAYRTMKGIERALGVVTEKPGQLEALIIEQLNELTSVKSSLMTMPPFKVELMQLCMIEPSSPNMLPSLPELLEGIRDYINTITRYRGGAMILHDLACQLTGTDSPATDAEPYANIPWQVLADRLEEQFNAPRRAILNLADNYELDRESDNYADAMAELYSFIKGLTVAQFKHDQQLQTLFADRNADRAIIGAIDDLCGDVANRPAVPVMAAIRALVQSHIRAIYSKEKNNG